MPGTGHDPSGSPVTPPPKTGGDAGAAGTRGVLQKRAKALVARLLQDLRLSEDPDAEWAEFQAAVERGFAVQAGRPLRARGEPAAPGQSTGGAMPTHPDAPAKARRPYLGFDSEEAAYARLKPELLRSAEGRYVVLVGDELVGPVATYGEALRAGYRRFGRGPLYVKRVLAEEPVDEVSRDITLCRP
jgi:hypothetical protein